MLTAEQVQPSQQRPGQRGRPVGAGDVGTIDRCMEVGAGAGVVTDVAVTTAAGEIDPGQLPLVIGSQPGGGPQRLVRPLVARSEEFNPADLSPGDGGQYRVTEVFGECDALVQRGRALLVGASCRVHKAAAETDQCSREQVAVMAAPGSGDRPTQCVQARSHRPGSHG